jgi:hypothetical protein
MACVASISLCTRSLYCRRASSVAPAVTRYLSAVSMSAPLCLLPVAYSLLPPLSILSGGVFFGARVKGVWRRLFRSPSSGGVFFGARRLASSSVRGEQLNMRQATMTVSNLCAVSFISHFWARALLALPFGIPYN